MWQISKKIISEKYRIFSSFKDQVFSKSDFDKLAIWRGLASFRAYSSGQLRLWTGAELLFEGNT